MRVLFVTNLFQCGGLERMVHLLGESLSKNFGCNVWLYSYDGDATEKAQEAVLKATGIRSIHQKKKPGFCWQTLWGIVQTVRKNKIQVIHTHDTGPLIYAAIARVILAFTGRFPKLIHTQHSFVHLQKRSVMGVYDRFFQRFASKLTVVSQQLAEQYVHMGVSPYRPIVIENGVEFAAHKLSSSEKLSLRTQLCTETAAGAALEPLVSLRWLVSIARVHPKKGQDHLIQLWGALSAQAKKQTALILVGPETEEGELDRLRAIQSVVAAEGGHILFVGATSTPMRWLMASDVFVSGSEYEGMPLAPIEACGSQVPMVLSAIEGHQLLKRHGAWFFEFDQPSLGAKVLEECLLQLNTESLEQSLLQNAQQIRELYSIRKMAKNYLNLYY